MNANESNANESNANENNANENNANATGRIGVVIVDGSDIFRRGLNDMVAEIDEVARSRTLAAIDDTVVRVDDDVITDVLVMSLRVRSALGSDIAVLNGLRTLVIVPSESETDIENAARVNADGYLMMAELNAAGLRRALIEICEDRPRLPNCMTAHLLRMAREEVSSLSRVNRLSPREQDVYQLVLTGQANKEIACSLGISIHGVKRHVSSILSKHNSPSRAHLVATVLSQQST